MIIIIISGSERLKADRSSSARAPLFARPQPGTGGQEIRGVHNIYIYIYIHVCVYIYIYRERERERDR